MKKFKFRLDTVLDLRKNREQNALRELAAAQRMLQASIVARNDFEAGLEQALIKREKLSDDICVASDFILANAFILGVKQQITRAHGVIRRAQQNVDRTMRDYLSARKSTMAIEKLRERDLEEFRLRARNLEARQQDDLSVMRSRFAQAEARANLGVNADDSESSGEQVSA